MAKTSIKSQRNNFWSSFLKLFWPFTARHTSFWYFLQQKLAMGIQNDVKKTEKLCHLLSATRSWLSEKALNLTALKEEFNAKGINCAPDICCPVFGGCRVGLIQSTTTHRLEWCQNPCNDQNSWFSLAHDSTDNKIRASWPT